MPGPLTTSLTTVGTMGPVRPPPPLPVGEDDGSAAHLVRGAEMVGDAPSAYRLADSVRSPDLATRVPAAVAYAQPARQVGVRRRQKVPRFELSQDFICELSLTLGGIFAAKIGEVKDELSCLGFGWHGEVYGRPKTPDSIEAKLNRVSPHHGNPGFRSRVSHLVGRPLTPDLMSHMIDEAMLVVQDGVGVTLLLDDPSPAGAKSFLDFLVGSIRDGHLCVVAIRNYTAIEEVAYFGPRNVQSVVRAAEDMYLLAPEVYGGVKDSGYTSVQFFLFTASGISIDLHVRGPLVDRVYRWEHFLFRCRNRNRLLSSFSPEEQEAVAFYRSLNPEQQAQINALLRRLYTQARTLEISASEPSSTDSIVLPDLPALFADAGP